MDITSISKAITAGRLVGARATEAGGADKVSGAFKLADKRIQQQRESTSVQLSSFGKLQSAVADTQTASRALSDTKQVGTDAGVKKATNTFVASFNNTVKAAKANITAQTSARESTNAKKADGDLRQTLTKDPTVTTDLKSIGITQQKDGSLAIDTKKFDAALQSDATAVRSTLDKLGQQVDKTATRQLASTGNIGSSVSTLNERATRLERQQENQQSRAVAVQQTGSQQRNTLSSVAEIYQRVFSI